MRSDMSKVIVERPRRERPARGSAYPRGRLKSRWWPDHEHAPLFESMGGGYADKHLNENLRPLVRFLRSCVGRPWVKVRSEIAAQVSCNSAVQKHVLDHLREYVHEHVRTEGKTVVALDGTAWMSGGLVASSGMNWQFYVCPRTGLLRQADAVPRWRPRASSLEPERHVLSEDRELRRIGGVWYELTTAPIPPTSHERNTCFDLLARAPVAALLEHGRRDPLWFSGRYAAAKRQLGTREIARHGLGGDP